MLIYKVDTEYNVGGAMLFSLSEMDMDHLEYSWYVAAAMRLNLHQLMIKQQQVVEMLCQT